MNNLRRRVFSALKENFLSIIPVTHSDYLLWHNEIDVNIKKFTNIVCEVCKDPIEHIINNPEGMVFCKLAMVSDMVMQIALCIHSNSGARTDYFPLIEMLLLEAQNLVELHPNATLTAIIIEVNLLKQCLSELYYKNNNTVVMVKIPQDQAFSIAELMQGSILHTLKAYFLSFWYFVYKKTRDFTTMEMLFLEKEDELNQLLTLISEHLMDVNVREGKLKMYNGVDVPFIITGAIPDANQIWNRITVTFGVPKFY